MKGARSAIIILNKSLLETQKKVSINSIPSRLSETFCNYYGFEAFNITSKSLYIDLQLIGLKLYGTFIWSDTSLSSIDFKSSWTTVSQLLLSEQDHASLKELRSFAWPTLKSLHVNKQPSNSIDLLIHWAFLNGVWFSKWFTKDQWGRRQVEVQKYFYHQTIYSFQNNPNRIAWRSSSNTLLPNLKTPIVISTLKV